MNSSLKSKGRQRQPLPVAVQGVRKKNSIQIRVNASGDVFKKCGRGLGESLASRVNPWFLFLAFLRPKNSILKQNGKQFFKNKRQAHRASKIQLKG